jgi:hypothetical protein
MLDAVFLVVLMLTAMGVALYLDRSECLRDWSKELGAGLLVCLLLCPMLGVATLGLAVYAGIRLFLRPRTLGHAAMRLTLLAAHIAVFLVCADTISSTATALAASFTPSSARTDPTEGWRAIADRDFSGSQDGGREGTPDNSSFSPPSNMGLRGLGIPGSGTK